MLSSWFFHKNFSSWEQFDLCNNMIHFFGQCFTRCHRIPAEYRVLISVCCSATWIEALLFIIGVAILSVILLLLSTIAFKTALFSRKRDKQKMIYSLFILMVVAVCYISVPFKMCFKGEWSTAAVDIVLVLYRYLKDWGAAFTKFLRRTNMFRYNEQFFLRWSHPYRWPLLFRENTQLVTLWMTASDSFEDL